MVQSELKKKPFESAVLGYDSRAGEILSLSCAGLSLDNCVSIKDLLTFAKKNFSLIFTD